MRMSEIVEIVDSLEEKIKMLLQKLESLKAVNSGLKEELRMLQDENKADKRSLVEWEEKYNSLKMATSMLGSNTDKTEAKLKINSLIRDLDHCIAQLAE